jgi:hypothetical protein
MARKLQVRFIKYYSNWIADNSWNPRSRIYTYFTFMSVIQNCYCRCNVLGTRRPSLIITIYDSMKSYGSVFVSRVWWADLMPVKVKYK